MGKPCIWMLFLGLYWGTSLLWAQSSLPTSEFPERYKITASTLDSLKETGLRSGLLKSLNTLLGKIYSSRQQFIEALKNLSDQPRNPQERNRILDKARLDRMMIRSEEFSGSLNEGESLFKGNVSGELPHEKILFSAGTVKILAEGTDTYNRIIGEPKVHIEKEDYVLDANYAVYIRIQKRLELKGNVFISGRNNTLRGATASLNELLQTFEIKGDLKEGVMIPASGKLLVREEDSNPTDMRLSEVYAQRIFGEKRKNQVVLEGNVIMIQPQRELYLKAGTLLLQLNANNEVRSMHAEQSVCIEQPGRVARAAKAHFDEVAKTILLEGNAQAYSNDTQITGETLLLYMDVGKGQVKGNSRSPIQVTLSLEENTMQRKPLPKPFSCR